MAKQSVFGTSVMGPDESAVGTIGNIAEMFNPENQAKGQMAQAHAEYYRQHGEQAAAGKGKTVAETQLLQQQIDARNVDSMRKAGYTDAQIAVMNGWGKSANDVAQGAGKVSGLFNIQSNTGDPNTNATLYTGNTPTINSAPTVQQGMNILDKNNESKLAQIVTQGKLHNQGILDRGVVIPSGGSFIPGYLLNQLAPSVAPAAGPSAGPSDLFNGQTQQLAPSGYMDSLGKPALAAPGLPAGAILNSNTRANVKPDREHIPFSIEETTGPVRQQIVDLFHTGTTKENYVAPDEETVVRPIINKQQELIASGKSTRSSSFTDALKELGFAASKEVTPEDKGGWFGIGSKPSQVLPRPARSVTPVDPVSIVPPYVNAPAVTTQATPDVITTAPAIADRVVGEVYTTPKGPLKWSGTGWVSP